MRNVRPKQLALGSFDLRFVNVKIILYGITALSTFVYRRNAGAELGHRRQYIAGIDRRVR